MSENGLSSNNAVHVISPSSSDSSIPHKEHLVPTKVSRQINFEDAKDTLIRVVSKDEGSVASAGEKVEETNLSAFIWKREWQLALL
mmetsp:Transcript_29120/g.38705  ORF Transcript_29120/g.38705 Transcript_29120/m.38705 type:complete len:86 (+) Transcript_29120:98-355(+)